MKTNNLKQGSKEWHMHRAQYRNASDAPAMMGKSLYGTRDELLAMVKFGGEKEFSAWAQKNLLDRGHAIEKTMLPYASQLIGADLFPVTGFDTIEGIQMSASFDGLTMDDGANWENKSINQKLRDTPDADSLDIAYRIQMEQQMLISGAEISLFTASDGTLDDMVEFWYESDPFLREEIIAGWLQFEKDLETFEIPEKQNKAVAKIIEPLPALMVGVAGQITTTNIASFEQKVKEFIESVNTDLQTDDDFANAVQTIKFCSKAETQIKAVKQHSVDQMADVSMVFKKMDAFIEQFSKTRLSLDKTVGHEKDKRRAEIVQDARNQLGQELIGCEARLGGVYVGHDANFEGVIKGKKSLDTMRTAINDEIARCKIQITKSEANVSLNIEAINILAPEFSSLFPDKKDLYRLPNEQVKVLIDNRIMKFNESVRIKEEAEAQKKKDEEAEALEQKKIEAEEMTNHDPIDPVIDDAPAYSNGVYSGGTYNHQREPEKSPESEPEAARTENSAEDQEAESHTEYEILENYVYNVQKAAMKRPFVSDATLNKFITTRFNRIMAAIEDVKVKSGIG